MGDNRAAAAVAGSRGARRRFSYSITMIGIVAAALIFVIALIALGSVTVYFRDQLRRQYLDYTVRVQSQLNTNTAASFKTLEQELFLRGLSDANISLINTTQDEQVFYRAKMALYNELANLCPPFPLIDGLCFYSPMADDYTPYVARSATAECAAHIRGLLTGGQALPEGRADLRWNLARLEGGEYLVRLIPSGGSVLGAWVSLPALLDAFHRSLPEETVVCMLDAEHELLQAERFPDYQFEPEAQTGYQEYHARDGGVYIVNVYKTPYSDCYLALFTPVSMLDSRLLPVYRGGLAVALVILAIVALIALTLKRLIDMPLMPLKQAVSLLQSGEGGAVQLNTDSRCREIQQLFRASNALLNDIQTLEARVYEEQLQQSRLELQFLKSQITPHFLINCLNAFAYLAASPKEADRAAAQRLTQTLSRHIRYSFTSAETVPLSQEFEHLENYLEMACIRYPDSLTYELALPEDCAGAQIPPMTLLTLCENTVKHNLIMGERLKIRVTARREVWKGRSAIHICYIDSGTGYSPEMIEHCNHILEHPEDARDGRHIGLYNIARAIRLSYQGQADFLFSNEPDAGARSDLYLPANEEASA